MTGWKVFPLIDVLPLQTDIYFTASPPKASSTSHPHPAGPPSPGSPHEQTSIYKISTFALMGQFLESPCGIKIPENTPLSPEVLAVSNGSEKSIIKQMRRVSLENSPSGGWDLPAPQPNSPANRTSSFTESDYLASTPSGTFNLGAEDKMPGKSTAV